ncbi:uncharacterized protein Tco025E_07324 [Trypanosoma conorhini]|uniref:C2 domain-containing protein n=1 Tax=Trypanosoma conorhini TaxID=83891 RepID=A0A3R7NJZ8_9TRYP|nr:uncharacterized protein Tco025E_07324 [Trypanosoma conorhini]RNF07608.1 hypothetical protein Tco025E_07324 [Trypanosoma conorhini]
MKNDWAPREALLLCVTETRSRSPTPRAATASHCEVQTTTHNFPASCGGADTRRTVRSTVKKVKTTMRCSLEVFMAFVSTPQNLQYQEDGVLCNDVIGKRGEALLMRTVYRNHPPLEVVTLRESKLYHVSAAADANEPLQRFLKTALVSVSHDGSVPKAVRLQGAASPALPATVYVDAVHSVSDEGTVPVSAATVRGWIHLSAFIAYEMPGPCVHLTFVSALDEQVAAAMGQCEKRVARIRNLCEMLQQMMSGGTLALLRQQHQHQQEKQMSGIELLGGGGSSEPSEPAPQARQEISVSGPPTQAQMRVLRPLLKLQNGTSWQHRLRHEGCDVEECEARRCIAAPPFLKAYRISTSIACSLATFFSLVGDPLQAHRYDAFLETSMIIDTKKEGEVVYGRCRRLATHSSLRDYCVVVTTVLLQPDQLEEPEQLLSVDGSAMMVYIQNAIQCNYRPHCAGYERQVVYAFGYIATNTAEDNRVRAQHIVCIDTVDNTNHRLELAMVQEHITRMAWVRQVCEDAKDKATAIYPSLASFASADEGNNTASKAANGEEEEELEEAAAAMSFIEVATIEDVNSIVYTHDSESCVTQQAPLDGSFEELEGIFAAHSSGVRTPSQHASPLHHCQTPAATAHSPHPRDTADRTSWATPIAARKQEEVAINKHPVVLKNTLHLPMTPPRDFLQVEIRSCRNMLRLGRTKHCVLFFRLRTSAASAQTARVALKESSFFYKERLLFEGPQGDWLTVIAVVRTASGRMKRLGKAILSLRNIRESEPHTRWVHLVGDSGTSGASVRGEVCITLRGGGLNARATVAPLSVVAEKSLRRRIRHFLMSSGRRHLHRLEWLVGRCWGKTPAEVDAVLAKYQTGKRQNNKVVLTVFDVQGLRTEQGVPLLSGPACQVWVETRSVRHCSRTVPLQQVAVFKEAFQLIVDAAEAIRVTVAVGGTIVGKVLLSPNPPKVGGVRVHTLFAAAGTIRAVPSGVITVALHGDVSHLGGHNASGDLLEEAARISRLRLLLWKHARNILHRLDVIAASLHDLEHYASTIGPCPPLCDVRVSVKWWEPSVPAWDSPATAAAVAEDDEGEREGAQLAHYRSISKRGAVYAVIHAGLHYYKSGLVRVRDNGTAQFDDPVTFHGVLPELDEVAVSIVGKGTSGACETDLGLAVLPLRALVRRQTLLLTLPLVRHAGTADAHFKGSVQVELFAVNFSGTSIAGRVPASARSQLRRLLYRYAPHQMHRVECLLLDHAGREEEFVHALLEKYGPDAYPSLMEIHLIGLCNFAPACACYVKVYLNGESVLRSSQQSGAENITFAPSDAKNTAVVTLDDPQHARLRFKVAQSRYLQSATVSFAEMSLRSMVAGCLNECWLPLFDSHGAEIGRLGVALKCNGFISREAAPVKLEVAEKDAVSLLRKYKREALPFLQPLMAEAGGAATVHAELRRRVAPRPIAATVYVCVEALSLTEPGVLHDPRRRVQQQQQQQQALRTPPPRENEGNEYTVSASCDREEVSLIWSEQLHGSGVDIRLDIPEFGRYEDHRLTLAVRRHAREARSLSRSGSKLRANSRGSRNNSPRQTTPQQLLPSIELGRVVVSLRALLTRSLYDVAERVTLPLVSFTQSPAAMRTLQQQLRPSAALPSPCSVVGSVSFRVRLPAFEHVPPWLRLHDSEMGRHSAINRACIRHYEEQIRDILARHEPQKLLDLHYTLYERDVAQGQWSLSLRDWKRVLLRRLGVAEGTPDVSSSSPRVKSRQKDASGRESAEERRDSKRRNGGVALSESTEEVGQNTRVNRILFPDGDASTPL